jgi:hypothetical protein
LHPHPERQGRVINAPSSSSSIGTTSEARDYIYVSYHITPKPRRNLPLYLPVGAVLCAGALGAAAVIWAGAISLSRIGERVDALGAARVKPVKVGRREMAGAWHRGDIHVTAVTATGHIGRNSHVSCPKTVVIALCPSKQLASGNQDSY